MLYNFSNQKIGVFGLGKSGNAACRFLVERGAEVFAWDDSMSSSCDLPTSGLIAGSSNPIYVDYKSWAWGELEYLVLSPGIPLTHPKPHKVVERANAANVQIICDVELLYLSNPDAIYIGITGTNGKSTTTALIGHVLREIGVECAVGGNIGIAACDLPSLHPSPAPRLPSGGGVKGLASGCQKAVSQVYVIEMSSYQLDLIDKTKFDIAILLNITPDHLDRHGDIDGYIAAKKRIFINQGADDIAIIAIDDKNCIKISEQVAAELVKISCEDKILESEFLAGKHNAQNISAVYQAVAAFLSSSACGEGRSAPMSDSAIKQAIESFKGLDHRLQLVAEINGVKFVNDSKATNDEAAKQALKAYDNIHWIVGGVAKDGGIDSLEPFFGRVKHAYLIGQCTDEFAGILDRKISYTKCGTIEKAVIYAVKNADNGDVVLLSPACASFDQFPNFEARGQKFIDIIACVR